MNNQAKPKTRPPIELHPVKSSQVSAIGYDPTTQTLAVRFTRGTGAIYHYPNVKPEDHLAFVNAPSIGIHFGQHIKKLPFEKFAPEDEPKAGS
jgi:hypothetical protein